MPCIADNTEGLSPSTKLSDRIIISISECSNSLVPFKEALLPPPSLVAELFLSNNHLVGESTALGILLRLAPWLPFPKQLHLTPGLHHTYCFQRGSNFYVPLMQSFATQALKQDAMQLKPSRPDYLDWICKYYQ